MVIILNEESLQLINDRDSVINYGFGSIELRILKSDSRIVLQPLAEAAVPLVASRADVESHSK